jgi:hypothetical protein
VAGEGELAETCCKKALPCRTYFSKGWLPKIRSNSFSIDSSKLPRLGSVRAYGSTTGGPSKHALSSICFPLETALVLGAVRGVEMFFMGFLKMV